MIISRMLAQMEVNSAATKAEAYAEDAHTEDTLDMVDTHNMVDTKIVVPIADGNTIHVTVDVTMTTSMFAMTSMYMM